MNRKAQHITEIGLLMFVCVFIAFFKIISSIYLAPVIESSEDNSVCTLIPGINMCNVLLLGGLIELLSSVYTFSYVHPYLAMIFGALVGVPLAYVFIRLFRGGG